MEPSSAFPWRCLDSSPSTTLPVAVEVRFWLGRPRGQVLGPFQVAAGLAHQPGQFTLELMGCL